MLSFTLLQPPFKDADPLAQADVQDQVDDRRNVIAGQRTVGIGNDDAVVVHDVADAEILDDGGLLHHGDELVADGGEDVFHRLGEDDVAHGLAPGHPAGTGRLHLPLVHRLDARPDDLGHVGRRVEGQCDDAGDGPLHIHAQDAPGGVVDEAQLEIDNVQLHQHGRSADDGDVDLGEPRKDLVFVDPHESDETSQDGSQEHRHQRHQNRGPRSPEEILIIVDENLGHERFLIFIH